MTDHEGSLVVFETGQQSGFPVSDGGTKFVRFARMFARDVVPLSLVDSHGEELSLVIEQEFLSPHGHLASPVREDLPFRPQDVRVAQQPRFQADSVERLRARHLNSRQVGECRKQIDRCAVRRHSFVWSNFSRPANEQR